MYPPMVHMNGTAQDELIEQLQGVGCAIADAIARLQEAAPNRRDYYLLTDEAWNGACAAHRSRRERLSAVLGEIQDLAEAIANQGPNRN